MVHKEAAWLLCIFYQNALRPQLLPFMSHEAYGHKLSQEVSLPSVYVLFQIKTTPNSDGITIILFLSVQVFLVKGIQRSD